MIIEAVVKSMMNERQLCHSSNRSMHSSLRSNLTFSGAKRNPFVESDGLGMTCRRWVSPEIRKVSKGSAGTPLIFDDNEEG